MELRLQLFFNMFVLVKQVRFMNPDFRTKVKQYF